MAEERRGRGRRRRPKGPTVSVLVKLHGAVAKALDELVKRGYFETKSEAVREGIRELARKYNILEKIEAE